jgi:hypothetical protein
MRFPTWLEKGGDIVTCRVARLSSDLPLKIMDLVFCCECGSSDLEVCYTSKTLGPHLCPTCIQSKVEYETWEKIRAGLSIREQPVT